MTDYNSVFVDTAPFIYFLDDDVRFGQKVKSIFEDILSSEKRCVSSVITCAEYLVYPYRNGNAEKEEAFFAFTSECGIYLQEITEPIAKRAALIRAEFAAFKAMDALQLATACELGCDVFLTNDSQLKQFKDLRCIMVDEWR